MRRKQLITAAFSLGLLLASVMPATGVEAATWFTNYNPVTPGNTWSFSTGSSATGAGGWSGGAFSTQAPAGTPAATWYGWSAPPESQVYSTFGTGETSGPNGTSAGQPGPITFFLSQSLPGSTATVPPPAAATPPPSNSGTIQGSNAPAVPGAAAMSPQEAQLFRLVNGARAAAGLPALRCDLRLVGIARAKAEDMVALNYFGHWSPTYGMGNMMMQKAGINFSLWGENLAGAPTWGTAFSALMSSPLHRDNILGRDYNSIGVGVAQGGEFGLVVVMEFAKET